MSDLFQGVLELLRASALEQVAVLLSIAYLILEIRQNIWCWACAFVSTALFTWIFFDVTLFAESLLNVFYMAMAVYGYWSWTHGEGRDNSRPIIHWSLKSHSMIVLTIFALGTCSGLFLKHFTSASWPFTDSYITCGSIIATFMITRKVFEHWYYWLILDSASFYLYLDRHLYSTALLTLIYLGLVVIGIFGWRKSYLLQST